MTEKETVVFLTMSLVVFSVLLLVMDSSVMDLVAVLLLFLQTPLLLHNPWLLLSHLLRLLSPDLNLLVLFLFAEMPNPHQPSKGDSENVVCYQHLPRHL